MFDVVSGAFGAIVGAAVSLLTTIINARTQRWQTRQQAAEREAENRRKSEAEFLASAKRFEGSAFALARTLAGELDLDRKDTYDSYHREWRHLHESEAMVEIVSPVGVGNAARNLRASLGGLRDVCDPWYITIIENGKANNRWDSFWKKYDDISECRVAFHEARNSK